MSIRFGTTSGYKTKTDFKISEGELDCGDTIHLFIKNIEKSYSFEDEFSICSIGILSDPNLCYETVSIKLTEEAMPKYKPTDLARGKDAEFLANLAIDGTAVTTLACTPLKIKSCTIEINATWKDLDITPLPTEAMSVTTADGLYVISNEIDIPSEGNQIVTSKSIDQPTDNFGSRTITYRKKVNYPDSTTRDSYLFNVDTYFDLTDPFDKDVSTVEVEINFRQGDVPMKKVTVTKYGIESIS